MARYRAAMRTLKLIWPLSARKVALIVILALLGLSLFAGKPVLPPDPEQQPVWYIWA
ncbi:MAG: hypothetical protein JO254_05375 [Pseudolabrys sp.]|nr:hypothetical protein [Pseudolabrys sp.]